MTNGAVKLGNASSTLAFDYGADTFIFTQSRDDSMDNSLDVVVYLEGTQVDDLMAVNATGDFDLMLTYLFQH